MDRERIEQLARGYLVFTQWFLVVGRAQFELREAGARAAMTSAALEDDRAVEAASAALLADASPPAQGPEEAVAREVERLISQGGPEAWPLLQAIVRQAPDDEHLLGYVGAGPFEDWASEERIEAVFEELAPLLRCERRWQIVARASWNVPPALKALLQPV